MGPSPSRGSQDGRRSDLGSKSLHFGFAIALGIAILLGILLAWTPRFWSVAVLNSAILLTATGWLFWNRNWNVPKAALLAIVIAGWGWLQLALFGSAARSSTRAVALEWTIAAIAFCLATQIFRHKKARNVFLALVLWGGAIFSAMAILQMYSSPNEALWLFAIPPHQQAVGTFLYKNQFAAMIEIAMPIALYWALKKERRSAGLFAFLILFAGAIASGSRAGASLVIVECLTVALLALKSGKLRLSHILVGLPVFLLLLVAVGLIAGSDSAFAHFQEVRPDAIRQELLKSTLQMYKGEPWSGYGLGAWSTVYPQYATFDIGLFANAAHNDWAEWAAEGGIVFVGSIFVLSVLTLRPAVRSVWGLGVIAIMLHSWVDYPTQEPVLRVLWFCMAGALLAKRDTKSSNH